MTRKGAENEGIAAVVAERLKGIAGRFGKMQVLEMLSVLESSK